MGSDLDALVEGILIGQFNVKVIDVAIDHALERLELLTAIRAAHQAGDHRRIRRLIAEHNATQRKDAHA